MSTSQSSTYSTWIATLEAQPWFAQVSDEFAELAPDVPAALWIGELYNEDANLNPAQPDYKNSGHYGLFQENANFPTTVGLSPATLAQLQSPEYNGYVAALAMEQAIKGGGGTTWAEMIQELEKAGWPGAISSSDEQTRFSQVQGVAAALGAGNITPTSTASSAGGPTSGTLSGTQAGQPPTNTPGDPCSQFWTTDPRWLACQMTQLTSGIEENVAQAAQQLAVAGVIVALLGGGFLLIANSIGVKPPAVAPVPVPV